MPAIYRNDPRPMGHTGHTGHAARCTHRGPCVCHAARTADTNRKENTTTKEEGE